MTRLRNLAFLALIFAATCHFSTSVRAAPQPPGATPNPAVQQPSKDVLPGLRQPGDDVSEELKDPLKSPDGKKTESMAAYMEAVAAQKAGNFPAALKAYEQSAAADPSAPEPVRALAILLMRLGKRSQAIEMAKKAIELDPDDYDMRRQMAEDSLRQRNAPEAIRLIEEAAASPKLKHDSRDYINIQRLRGALYVAVRDLAKAAKSYRILLTALERPEDFGLDFREHQALMNDQATGYETIGKVMLDVGRNDDAITAFQALARVKNDRPGDHHYWLALAQYRKDDLKPSEKNLNRYFETNRRRTESLRLVSDLFNATSRADEIPGRLAELAENTNEANSVNLFLGQLLIEKGDSAAATQVFESVIANSADADAYLGLVQVDILNRDAVGLLTSINKALKARIQVQELLPLVAQVANHSDFAKEVVAVSVASLDDENREQDPRATYFYSLIAERLELLEQEETLLQATLDNGPDNVVGADALNRLGLSQYSQDKFVEAAITFRRLLAMRTLPPGDRVTALYRLSYAETFNENYEAAIVAVETALKLVPQHAELTFQLGWVQLQADDFDASERTLKSAITLAESDPKIEARTRLLLGALYTQQGKWSKAIRLYEELLAIPEIAREFTRRGRMALSNAYAQSGDMANGERILEEVYAQTPNDPGVNNDLGYLYAEQNKNLEKAEKMVRIAVEAEPENPAYLDSLGWVLYRLGKNEEALEALKKANADPDYRDSTIIEHLGDVEKALGKDEDARKSWTEAQNVENESAIPDETILKRLKDKLGSKPASTEESKEQPVQPGQDDARKQDLTPASR
ncbi:MAG: tetratricopeptide repeat protein [Fuerstiella sp.]